MANKTSAVRSAITRTHTANSVGKCCCSETENVAAILLTEIDDYCFPSFYKCAADRDAALAAIATETLDRYFHTENENSCGFQFSQ